MELTLHRKWFTGVATIGELLVDGHFESFTLEDRYRPPPEPKVPRQTCIPDGSYQVIINRSKRFGVDMPLLLEVPGFSGIRIHPGNTAADTEGCILVGQARQVDKVLFSRAAYDALFPKLKAALIRGERITINVNHLKEEACIE